MERLLRIPGIKQVVSFGGYIKLNQPQLTRLAGIGLLLMIGFSHVFVLLDHFQAAAYLGLLFAALFVGTLVSAAYMLARSEKHRRGWHLGAALSVAAIVGYVVSRTWGLPGFEAAWDTPAGSFAVLFELSYLAVWFAVMTGMAVAAPERRDWYDARQEYVP